MGASCRVTIRVSECEIISAKTKNYSSNPCPRHLRGKRMIIGIDPGNEQTAFALIRNDYSIIAADKVGNEEFLTTFRDLTSGVDCVAIESIQSYGMTVGRSVFETCYMIGRIIQTAKHNNLPYKLYPRPKVARSLVGTQSKTNDASVRQALLLRFGGDKKGEPIFPLKGGGSDKRSAYAVAVYHLDGAILGGW